MDDYGLIKINRPITKQEVEAHGRLVDILEASAKNAGWSFTRIKPQNADEAENEK